MLPDFFPQLDSAISVDQTSQSGRTLLRFGTQVNKQGTGPGILISGRPGIDPIPSGAPITSWVNPDGSQNVLQGVYNFNGSTFTLSYYRSAGKFTYHSAHGHFHYDGNASYKLRQRNANGTPGDYDTRADGSGVVGTKTGFCLINTSTSFTMENGQSSTGIAGYGGSGQPSTGCGFLQGVRVGHADEYTSGLEGQWIDVTGVPNGQYFVEIALDGEDAMLESNESNNAKSFAYTLNVNNPGGGIAPDVFDTVTSTNNTLATAEDMGVMGTFNQTGLSIHFGQDFDWFRFEASSSGSYNIAATGTNGNLDFYLYDSTGAQLRSGTGTGSSETLSYPFVAGQTYYVKAEAYNSATVSNYQINWQLKPTVTNAASDNNAGEFGGNTGAFQLARNGPTTSPLSVGFTLGGTAVRDVDYTVVADSVTHAQGAPLNTDAIATFFVLAGDANHDRSVNINDFSALAANFNLAGTFSQGNFNYDALVDIADFALLASGFNTSLPTDPRGSRPAAIGSTPSSQSALPPRSPFAGSRIDSIIEELGFRGSEDSVL